MRKKSHILLARYIANELKDEYLLEDSLQSHRKAFCLGNILPDIRPSFVTKKHEYYGTIDDIIEKLYKLVNVDYYVCCDRVFWRRFGEALHYIADYFTFPHNINFTGTIMDHNKYEKILKNSLKKNLKNGNIDTKKWMGKEFDDLGEIIDFIKISHDSYMQRQRDINDDMGYITMICSVVTYGIISILEKRNVLEPIS